MHLYLTCLGGYRERETPGPIPNPEAKPPIADNTAPCRCGNVGRCLVIVNITLILPDCLLSIFPFRSFNLLCLNIYIARNYQAYFYFVHNYLTIFFVYLARFFEIK